MQDHPFGKQKWVVLDAEARTEAIFDIPVSVSLDKAWCCVHCRDLSGEKEPDELDVVKAHLASQSVYVCSDRKILDAEFSIDFTRHEIEESEINVDYYRCYGAEPPSIPPCTVVLSAEEYKRMVSA
jgi:hypothetical protein